MPEKHKINKKSWIRNIVLLCGVPFFLSGCWNQTEVDSMAFVTSVGIDLTPDNTIELSVEIAAPKNIPSSSQEPDSEGGSSGSESLVRSATGNTLNEATRNLQKKFSREIFWGQTEVLVLGKSIAKEGIQDHIDFFSRHPEARLDLYPFVSGENPKDLLKGDVGLKMERNMADLLKNELKQQMDRKVTLNEVLQTLSSDGKDVIMPWLEPIPNEKIPYINGKAIFRKDHLVRVAKGNVSKGMVWINNDVQPTSLNVKMRGKKGGSISLDLLNTKSVLTPKIEQGEWIMTIDIQAEAELVQNATKLDVSTPKMTQSIEQQAEKLIQSQAHNTIKQAKNKWKADIFGFGEAFHRKYPKQWHTRKNDWDDFYPNINVQLTPHVKIKDTGLNTSPPDIPEEKVRQK